MDLTEPSFDSSLADEFASELEGTGVDLGEAMAVSRAIENAGFFTRIGDSDVSGDDISNLAHGVSDLFHVADSRDVIWLRVAQVLTRDRPPFLQLAAGTPWVVDGAGLRRFVEAAISAGVSFGAAVEEACQGSADHLSQEFIEKLWRAGAVGPAVSTTTNAIARSYAAIEDFGFWGIGLSDPSNVSPLHPLFWISLTRGQALDELAAEVVRATPEEVGRMALVVLAGFESWWQLQDGPGENRRSERDPGDHAKALLTMFDAVAAAHRSIPDDWMVRWACWRLATWVLRRERLEDSDAADEVTESARRAFGHIRPMLRGAGTTTKGSDFKRLTPPLEDAVEVLRRFGSLWQAVRPLLLALRALAVSAVAADLRYWAERGLEDPPDGWRWVPERLAGLLHTRLGIEEKHDRDLVAFREKFASYLLDRLKSNKKDAEKGPVEADPIWRRCMIRAVQDLKVNPKGRGHRVLHARWKNDPDPDVKLTAKRAYESLRRGARIQEGTSPRRPILTAVWWLRQAHVLAIGQEVDQRGAQRTLRKEVQRTTEKAV